MIPIESLLDATAKALISGDFAALALLSAQVESASLKIPDRVTAERLRTKSERNARLLEAALRGVKAARLRLSEIKHGTTLTTYDARGRKALLAPIGTDTARRV